ncbi:NF038132 family protein [Colwellia sp. 6_MG-2023]|uniref:NF038132 family protein n=1 Tax=Colwellia sp. 6_MG-2023 TaxID=3062676 RepID=UPI0026E18EFD|nr:NF038132 family protein [Colwellia sp. 6_MG-2023]MDO6486572.1 NF038132 family protein [Colwellia sp. 6_MG-2023]
MLKKIKYIITTAVSVISLNTSATLISSTFENGIPTSWECNGNCGVSSANGVVTTPPTGNTNYGWISTDAGVKNIGLTGLLGADGSILQSSLFSANSGDDLEFYFNYVTSDGTGYSDYAWTRLLDDSFKEVAMLFSASTNIVSDIVAGNGLSTTKAVLNTANIVKNGSEWKPLGADSGRCFLSACGYTGWIQSNYSILETGNYYLEFGVANWLDSNFDSGLAFDGIKVAGIPFDNLKVPSTATTLATDKATSVPEPSSVALFALAFLGLISAKRKYS